MQNRDQLLDQLAWQIEMGVVDRITGTPINRLVPRSPAILSAPEPQPEQDDYSMSIDAADIAKECTTIEELYQALEKFPSPLKVDASRTVLADGNPNASLMIIGEAPGAEEDRLGRPFTGKAGMLLDKALERIGLDRHNEDPKKAAYLTNIAYWRPKNNRTPTPEECRPLLPFCEQHILLARPQVLLLLGNTATKNLLQTESGITRIRGSWKTWVHDTLSIPAMPSFHPAYLLRNPTAKAHFWNDLLEIQEQIKRNTPQPT